MGMEGARQPSLFTSRHLKISKIGEMNLTRLFFYTFPFVNMPELSWLINMEQPFIRNSMVYLQNGCEIQPVGNSENTKQGF